MKKNMLVFSVLITTMFVLGCFGGEQKPATPTAQSTTLAAVGEVTSTTTTTTIVPTTKAAVVTPTVASSTTAPETKLYEINMTASRYSFNPSTIRVNQGDVVKITLTSADVTHGFAIKEYDVNVEVAGSETKTIEFTADKKGTFTYYCSVYCGSGHRGMEGTLIVE